MVDALNANLRIGVGSAGTERIRVVGSTGNVLINTTTDAGFRLDVNGTARVGTTLTVGSSSQSGIINLVRPDGAVMTTISSPDVCIINNAQGSGVRLNSDNVTYFHVRGFASQFAANVTGALTAVSGLSTALLVNNVINASANNNTLVGLDINPTFNNGAFTGVTNRHLRLLNPSAANGEIAFSLLSTGGGYSSTFIQDGSGLSIGHNSGSRSFSLRTADSIRMQITGGGNVLINTTTDAGFRLDVNGTARVSGRLEIQNSSGLNIRTTVGAVSTSFRPSGNDAELRTNDASVACAYFYQNGNVGFSQRVVFGSTTLNASAQLQIDSTTRGFLPPRMTTTERNAIASPAEGLQVWDTTLKLMFVYNGTTWISL
jgi:hypothetical protein